MSEKIVVKYAEAAEMLSTSTQTIKEMVKMGRLQGVRLLGKKAYGGVTVESVKVLAKGGGE